MAKSIEEYTAEVKRASEGSRNALQNQIDAISGNLAQTQKQINENYANQQNQLNAQKNQAAEAASMRAAGSGGSFGGAANIANRKYYEQTFVPAQTQLNTNQSQALENAQSQANANRLTLQSQLAALNDQDTKLGLQRYYDVLAQERQEALQRAQIAAQNAQAAAYQKYANAAQAQNANTNTAREWDFGNGYTIQALPGGEAVYFKNGNKVSAGRFLEGTGAYGANWNMWKDVWANASTKGVGSDTVSAFNRRSSNDSRYGYLFR